MCDTNVKLDSAVLHKNISNKFKWQKLHDSMLDSKIHLGKGSKTMHVDALMLLIHWCFWCCWFADALMLLMRWCAYAAVVLMLLTLLILMIMLMLLTLLFRWCYWCAETTEATDTNDALMLIHWLGRNFKLAYLWGLWACFVIFWNFSLNTVQI